MNRYTQLTLKRAFDTIVSIVALTLLSPLIGLIALAIRITTMGSSVLFRQTRPGLHGKPFTISNSAP